MCQNVCLRRMQGWEVSCLEREPGMAAPLGAAVVGASWALSPALGPSLGDCCLPWTWKLSSEGFPYKQEKGSFR